MAPGWGLCLPFWGAVLVLLAAVWEVSGVYLHVSLEGSVSFWTRTPVRSLFPWRWASVPLLLGPPAAQQATSHQPKAGGVRF